MHGIVAFMYRASCNGEYYGIQRQPASTMTGVILAKYNETINLSIKSSFILPFQRRNKHAEILLLEGTLFDDDRCARTGGCGHQKGR